MKKFVGEKLVAGYLGTDVQTVRRAVREGKLSSRWHSGGLQVDIDQAEVIFGHSRHTRHHEHEPVGA